MGQRRADQIVILAGGLGTRLRPLTHKLPKALIEVKGRPFLHYLLLQYVKQGYKRFLLLTGYLGDQIAAKFGRGEAYGVELSYSREATPLGTGGALKLAEPLLDDHFFLVNGDTYAPIDLAKLEADDEPRVTGLISVYDNQEAIAPNNVLVAADGLVKAYAKNDPRQMNGVEAGVSLWAKRVLRLIPGGSPVSLEEDIYPKLIGEQQLKGQLTSQRFYDIGTFERLRMFEEVLQ